MAYVYQHVRLDTNEVFYVGVGKRKGRSHTHYGRNKHWHHIVNKVGYSVQIIAENISYQEALDLEKNLIKTIGRKDLGLGPLVNMTDGGEGSLGHMQSEGTRSKRRDSMIGKNKREKSEETRKRISLGVNMAFINKLINKYGEEEGKIQYELFQKRKNEKPKYNHTKNRTWMNNECVNKRVKPENIGEYLKNGWILGRLEKTIDNIKKSLINRIPRSGYHQHIIQCPHCGKIGGNSNMIRYHFDNCKVLHN